jgi:hypothetical protein
MLRPTSLYVNDGHMKRMATLAEAKGLALAQLVRVAIAEYLRRESQRAE